MQGKIQKLIAADYVSPPPRTRRGKRNSPVSCIRTCPCRQKLRNQSSLQREDSIYGLHSTFRMHRFDEALNHVNAALRARPDWVPALRLRAGIYGEQRRESEAIADLSRILNNVEDGSGHLHGERARLFEQRQKPERAVRTCSNSSSGNHSMRELGGRLGASLPTQTSRSACSRSTANNGMPPDNVASYQLDALLAKERGNWQDAGYDNSTGCWCLVQTASGRRPTNQSWFCGWQPLDRRFTGSDDTCQFILLFWRIRFSITRITIRSLVAEETGATYGGMEPANCVQPPAEYKAAFDQVLARSYTKRKNDEPVLRHAFTFLVPIGY